MSMNPCCVEARSNYSSLPHGCIPVSRVYSRDEIDGEPYWDGGYVGNPAIFPLIYDTRALDVLLVKINPLSRPDTPRTSLEIMDRLSEITFNASLIGEMRAIDFVTRLLKENKVESDRYKALRLHMIADERGLSAYEPSSKFNTDIGFLEKLFDLGRKAAGRWLDDHADDVGVRSSLDIARVFLKR
jgi:NTE family protein